MITIYWSKSSKGGWTWLKTQGWYADTLSCILTIDNQLHLKWSGWKMLCHQRMQRPVKQELPLQISGFTLQWQYRTVQEQRHKVLLPMSSGIYWRASFQCQSVLLYCHEVQLLDLIWCLGCLSTEHSNPHSQKLTLCLRRPHLVESNSVNFRQIQPESVLENTYFTFFSDLKKHDFLHFLKWRIKKSLAKISLVLNPSKWVNVLRSSIKFAECL